MPDRAAHTIATPGLAANPAGVSRALFNGLASTVTTYPRGMVPVPQWNPHDGFFPGASGHWRNPTGQVPSVFIVGQDFGTMADYDDSVASGEDPSGPTWRALLGLLQLANVSPSRCFFTNAIVGLRTNDDAAAASQPRQKLSNTGRSPAFRDPAFIAACARFLAHQIQTLRPASIVLLGSPAAEVFARIATNSQPSPWGAGFGQWDLATRFRPVHAVVDDHTVSVVRLLHPCLRESNLWRRGGRAATAAERRAVGDRAEIQLLRTVADQRR